MRLWYLNQDPTAGFFNYLQQRGLAGGDSPVSRFAIGRQADYFNNYLSDAASNPDLGFYDYLQQKNFDPSAEYANQSPEQRGDFSSRTYVPRGRWVNI